MISPKVGENTNSDNKELFAFIKNVIFLIAIYLYFTGWAYAYFFYKYFGISLGALDINYLYFFIYSYPVISSNLWLFVCVCLFVALLFLIRFFFEKQRFAFILMPTLVVLFPLFFNVALKTGESEANKLRHLKHIRTISFDFVKNDFCKNSQFKEFCDANSEKDALILIKEAKDRYYVLYQHYDYTKPQSPEPIGLGYVYQIQKKDICLARVNVLP